jgi:hypothetical protein
LAVRPLAKTSPETRSRHSASRGPNVRQYHDIEINNDMADSTLSTQNAPDDYVLPQKLDGLPALGAGVLSWQDRRVSMVCLDSGAQGTLLLFVVDGAAVKNAPVQREYAPVSELTTVSWSEGGRTYVLAGQGGKEALQRFF